MHIGLFTTVVAAFEKVTEVACAADVEPISKAVLCGIAVGGSVLTLLYGAYKALNTPHRLLLARQEQDLRLASQMIHAVPRIPGKSVSTVLNETYAGIPLLAAYHDCYGPGCFEIHYQPHTTKAGQSMHRLSISPRNAQNSTILPNSKRDDKDESANEDGLYGEYVYNDEDKGAQVVIAGDDSQKTFVDTLEADMNNNEWSEAGIHCFNVLDTDSNTPASSGYLSLNNGSPYQNPDEEDGWISTCVSKSS